MRVLLLIAFLLFVLASCSPKTYVYVENEQRFGNISDGLPGLDSTAMAYYESGSIKYSGKYAVTANKQLSNIVDFPSLYLELQVESLMEFARQEQVRHEKRKTWSRQLSTDEYLSDLNRIIESGFLREFIMDQYNMILIVPKNVKLDFRSYRQWILAHPISISLNKRLYVISYNDKK